MKQCGYIDADMFSTIRDHLMQSILYVKSQVYKTLIYLAMQPHCSSNEKGIE
jgi:hypothetical protein